MTDSPPSAPGATPHPKPSVLLMGQTPPPWHGQAVATKILFDHEWPEFSVHRLRMEFSEEMHEVGRFQWRKIVRLFQLIQNARRILKAHPGTILFYPPASAKWIPFLRDLLFLGCVRHLASSTVFIFHASGLANFVMQGGIRRRIAQKLYGSADLSLEVAIENVPPHEVFHARAWQWCPCAIDVPELSRATTNATGPLKILFVGSLQEGKGILEILRTAALLRDRGKRDQFQFEVVGKWISDDFESEARGLHKQLALDDMVHFAGQLTGEDKWRAYAEADVFLFPTHYASEATPIVIMEALGAGLPVISTRWAGIPAMLEGCTTARLYPTHSPADYADALEDVARASNPPAIAAASRAFYLAHFIPRKFVERVEGALTEMLQAKRGECLELQLYLADQNPKLGRSLGISRMTQVVLRELRKRNDVRLSAISSKSSLQAPGDSPLNIMVPWQTKNRVARVLTDHLHPLLLLASRRPDVWYFPKGFLPGLHYFCQPSVVTIHDTIIQYYSDHYPDWRTETEYRYWAAMLKHTLRNATSILTVSNSAKEQITAFMGRHGIPPKTIHVTYEPCLYEEFPQPVTPPKADYVLHLGSREPHKRTEWLIRQWALATEAGEQLPALHVVGSVPAAAEPLAVQSNNIVRLPFLEDDALRSQFSTAKALILPSEIEGFGLPAIEAYYLGTPVCYTLGTSIEEVLSVATTRGGFKLDDPVTFFAALEDVMTISPEEIHDCGIKLRDNYAAATVAEKMMAAFQDVRRYRHQPKQPRFAIGAADAT